MPRPNKGAHLLWHKKRKFWYIREFIDGKEKLKSTGTKCREEAEAGLAEFIRKTRNTSGPQDPSQYLIADALANFSEDKAPGLASGDRVGYALMPLLDFWGECTVDAINETTCKAYTNKRERSAGTVRRELGILRAALNFERNHGRLTFVPHMWFPSPPAGKGRWLTRSEAARLIRAARRTEKSRDYLALFIILGLYTGARKGALLELRWTQVDLNLGRIDLNPPGRVRTSKGRSIIPIPRRLHWFLKKARARSANSDFVIHRNGKPIKDIKKSFIRAAMDAGMTKAMLSADGSPKTDNDGNVRLTAEISPHVLRHTAGTWLAQKGVDRHEIAGWLGHSYERTAELYSHHHPDYFSSAKRAFD